MQMSLHPGLHHSSRLKLRLSALFCLLLVLTASTAQVAHSHPGEFSALQSASSHAPTHNQHDPQNQKNSEASCALCMAMHAVLPVATNVAVAPVVIAQSFFLAPPSFHYISRWSFTLFSRPPPARA